MRQPEPRVGGEQPHVAAVGAVRLQHAYRSCMIKNVNPPRWPLRLWYKAFFIFSFGAQGHGGSGRRTHNAPLMRLPCLPYSADILFLF